MPTALRRIVPLLVAAAPLGPVPLQGQERLSLRPCAPRHCVAAPCPPPPCANLVPVVRTGREVSVQLDGRVLRYEVTERWTNTGRAIGEADYVLPMPRGAAFEDLALEIDGELVTGEALGAGEARRIYEEIVRRQRDPALVEWMEMGLLRTRIFPIQPGETRTVKVRFRAVAEREGDALRIDVPAPRGQGTGASGTALSFRWPGGDAFGDAWSPTHRVEGARDGAQREVRVADATGTVTLLLPVRAVRAAAISLLTHAPHRGDGYALITLSPPTRAATQLPRDVTFVIDVSGSMSGAKMDQARAAGRQLLNSLGHGDRFRLIAFAGDVTEFREGWTAAVAEERRAAARWLDDLRAVGGTNISGALERALETPTRDGRLGFVLFLTDGAPTVGERRADRIAARAAELRGERRVFTFGLGADVNAGLLEQLALEGAGTAHFVRPEEDVERVVGVVAQRITRPVATDLRVRAHGVHLHAVQPAGRVDLFAGQELTILARYNGEAPRGRVTVTGQTPEGPVTWEATASFPAQRNADAFVGRLWATQRVGWLSAERRRGGPSSEIDDEIRALGERWGIPTEMTSYLVLEPGLVTSAPGRGGVPQPVPTGTRRDAEPERILASPNSVSLGLGAVSPSAFEQAKASAEMRDSRSLGRADALLDRERSRLAGARLFTLRDSMWVDSRPEAANARRVVVKPYSPAYFALMERVGVLREIFAVGDRVQAHGTRVTVVVTEDGVERLTEAALAQVARDW